MSTTEGSEPTEPLAAQPRRRGKLRLVIIAVVVLLLVIGAGGAFAVWKFLLPHGRDPEAVLPASSTVAVLSIDGDPSASQKLAALHFSSQFPAVKQQLGITDTSADLRQVVLDAIFKDAGCNITFDKDIKPWIGKRFAIAGVQGLDKSVDPIAVIQLSDADAAKKKWASLESAKCTKDSGSKPSPSGEVFTDDYLVVAPSKARAQQVIDQAKKHSLADDADFKKWQGALGDRGILNAYVAKGAWTAASDKMPADVKKSLTSCGSSFDKFTGASATVRFGEHGLELAAVAGGLNGYAGSGTVAPALKRLPGNTAIVASAAFGPTVAADLLASVKCSIQAGDSSVNADEMIQQFQKQTGITLPGDLQTVFGNVFTIALGGNPPADLSKISGPGDVPAAITVDGDGPKIQAVVAKALGAVGSALGAPEGTTPAEVLTHLNITEKVDAGTYTIGGAKAFVDSIGSGNLTADPSFAAAVPDWKKAVGVFFLRFDSAWRDALLAQAGQSSTADQAKANTAPISALGLESWVDSTGIHATIKLATK